MYDNFLTTCAFEQMAREYNAKYNRATLFSLNNKDEEIKLKVKKDFEKFSHLFYLLQQAFKQSAYKFNRVFLQFEEWQEDAKRLFEVEITIQKDNIPKYITHKFCAIELMELMVSFVKTFGGFVIEEDFTSNNKGAGLYKANANEQRYDNETIKKACSLYIKAIEIIRDFYNNI